LKRLDWNPRSLPAEIAHDMRDAAIRKGAPLPPSAPRIALTRKHTESDVLRPPPKPRRRVVVIRRGTE
jgi:hypothetical protein